MTNKLDYTALEKPVLKADIEAYKATTEEKKAPATIATIPLTILAILMALGVVFLGIKGYQDFGVLSLFPIAMVIGIGLMAWYYDGYVDKRRVRLYKFATDNKLQLFSGVASIGYSGMIFDNGHSQQINDMLKFPDGTEIGNYTHVTGSGKSRRTHSWGFVRVKLARRLPHMILDAKSNNFWKISNLSDTIARSQILSLEGGFNDYFTLYAPKQYERDALYVFTPDVMATMVDYGKDYDIEIIDDELYIYDNKYFPLENAKFYEYIVSITTAISSELINQTDYYSDEQIGDRAVNLVAAEGRRLKTGFSWLTVVLTILVVLYYIPGVIELISSILE